MIEGWKAVDAVPSKPTRPISPMRLEAEKVLTAFIDSGDSTWVKDFTGEMPTGESCNGFNPTSVDMNAMAESYRYVIRTIFKTNIKVAVRGPKLYLYQG